MNQQANGVYDLGVTIAVDTGGVCGWVSAYFRPASANLTYVFTSNRASSVYRGSVVLGVYRVDVPEYLAVDSLTTEYLGFVARAAEASNILAIYSDPLFSSFISIYYTDTKNAGSAWDPTEVRQATVISAIGTVDLSITAGLVLRCLFRFKSQCVREFPASTLLQSQAWPSLSHGRIPRQTVDINTLCRLTPSMLLIFKTQRSSLQLSFRREPIIRSLSLPQRQQS